MKRVICNAFVLLCAVGFVCFSTISIEAKTPNGYSFGSQGDQDFVLLNKTGVEIYAVYVSPHDADTWGNDILGVDTLAADESVKITFESNVKAAFWDLRVENEDGDYIEFAKINLLKVSRLTIYFENGAGRAYEEYGIPAQDNGFVLVNQTGVEIYAVYVSPNQANAWGEDILDVDTLSAGESFSIAFAPKEKTAYWDLRVEDEDGASIEWKRLKLLGASKVTLYFKNSKATAVVE